jgi:ribonuclease HI
MGMSGIKSHKKPVTGKSVKSATKKAKVAETAPASDKKLFRVFTDGACQGNGKSWALAGIGVHFPRGQIEDIGLPFTVAPITNQRAELAAILYALTSIYEGKLYKGYDAIALYTDSDYSIKCVTLWLPGWRAKNWVTASGTPVKNLDIILPIDEMLTKLKAVKVPVIFVHVRSHTEKDDYRSRHNAIADTLATQGVLAQKKK